MKLNADFEQFAAVAGDRYEWVASPMPGVDRVMLDRIGDEVARATSIVNYAPDSRFSEHVHTGGEEFLVLEGVFSDADGNYPAGSYVRNPPGTAHAPWSTDGCTIFVKLQQFAEGDDEQFAIETDAADWQPHAVEGVEVLSLHGFGSEQVRMVRYAPGTAFPRHDHPGGEEVLVVEGSISDENGRYPAGSWFRYPPGSAHTPVSETGALLWVKVGHLDPPVWNKA